MRSRFLQYFLMMAMTDPDKSLDEGKNESEKLDTPVPTEKASSSKKTKSDSKAIEDNSADNAEDAPKKVSKTAGKKTAKGTSKKTTKDTAKKPTKKSTKDSPKKSTKAASKKASKDADKDTAKDSPKKASKAPGKKKSKDTSKTVAEDKPADNPDDSPEKAVKDGDEADATSDALEEVIDPAKVQLAAMEEATKDLSMAEIEAKRSKLNRQAEIHRSTRDKLNAEARKWVEERDKLNDQVRKLVDRANAHRETRDQLNVQVQTSKQDREEWNTKALEYMAQVNHLKRKYLPKDGTSLSKLKRERNALEFRQMTQVLKADKEKALMEQLGQIQRQIKEREGILNDNSDVTTTMALEREARDKAEEAHRMVGVNADMAQVEHDSMLELFFERDKVRKEADKAQEKFIEAKMASDEEHKSHVEIITQVHDIDKILTGIHQRKTRARKDKEESVAKAVADDVFGRFRAGEKLSTEDLMMLQKAGFL